ncbi:hypothetical protein BC332_33798 [Capsicum chinense]|nr:hypothetical protein BC332_33798 [Capsicum chinense]
MHAPAVRLPTHSRGLGPQGHVSLAKPPWWKGRGGRLEAPPMTNFDGRIVAFHGGVFVKLDIRAPWHQGSLAPWRQGTKAPRHHGSVAPWHQGTKAPWRHGTVAPWHRGAMAPWHQGPKAPWRHGT